MPFLWAIDKSDELLTLLDTQVPEYLLLMQVAKYDWDNQVLSSVETNITIYNFGLWFIILPFLSAFLYYLWMSLSISLLQILQYARFVKPSFEEFILPSKKYADIIIPRGGDNDVAIDLIVQHILTKLGQHDLCKIYSNVDVIVSTFQVRQSKFYLVVYFLEVIQIFYNGFKFYLMSFSAT